MRIHYFVWQILLWLCLCIWNLGRWNVCPISMGSEKSKKEASVGIRRNRTETAKNEIYSVISLNADLCIRIYEKVSWNQSVGSIFYVVYRQDSRRQLFSRMGNLCTKIPDASYLAGWVIFVLILVGMCLKERFFCQYLCPMGAIFAWLPTLPFSVLDRDRSNCIPKCRACEIKCPVDHQIKRDQKNGGECIHCMQCVDVCPKQNIHLGSGKKLKGNEIVIILLKLVLFIGVCIFAQSL